MKLHGHAWGLIVLILLALTSVNSTTEDPEDTDPDNEEAGEEEDEVPLTKNVKDDLKVPGASNKDYEPPEPQGSYHFAEPFKTEADFQKRWIISQSKKEYFEESKGKYEGLWAIEEPKTMRLGYDLGLVLKSKAKHHAVSAKLDRTYEFEGKPFIVQYEVRFQNGHDCGGAYIKLLTKDKKLDLTDFRDTTGYTIMFGPDRCGHESKLHFIFRHRSPKTGVIEEKHAKKPKDSIDHIFSDKKTHLFTLVIEPDNTFEIYLDQKLVNTGSLLQDVEPAVNPPKEIIDRTDRRPMDWDDREKIPDPEAKKPDDWDENEPEMIPDENAEKPIGWLDNEPDLIPDPDAEKPKDWDEDMDGEWEAPMINNPKCESAPGCGVWKRPSVKNPKYKGKFKPPMVANPNYAGKWKPRMIPNPDFFEDLNPYKMMPIEAIGLELWSMTDDIIFDNFIITDDKAVADKYAEDSWNMKRAEEFGGPSGGFFQSLLDAADERKWLYAVYLVVVLLPVVALSIWLCPTKGPIKPADLAARQKKTDEPSPDDVSEPVTEVSEAKEGEEDKKEEDAVDDAAGGGDAPGSPSKTTKKKSKSDLEAEEASEQANEADGEEENEEVTSTSNANPDVRTSPRKRQSKPRKD